MPHKTSSFISDFKVDTFKKHRILNLFINIVMTLAPNPYTVSENTT